MIRPISSRSDISLRIVAELRLRSVYLEIVLLPTGSPVSRYVRMMACRIFLFLSGKSIMRHLLPAPSLSDAELRFFRFISTQSL